jgi:hypothetical protein
MIYAVAKPNTPYMTATFVPRSGARFAIRREVSIGNIPRTCDRESDGMAVARLLIRQSTEPVILRIAEARGGAGSARTARLLASVNTVVRCGLMSFDFV